MSYLSNKSYLVLFLVGADVSGFNVIVKDSNKIGDDRRSLQRHEFASIDINRCSRIFARAWQ